MDKLLENLPSILTLIGVIIVNIIGQRLEKIKQDAAQKKVTVDAADGVRDDLMKQVEEANKRIDKKDEVIENLNKRINQQDRELLDLRWDVYLKTARVEQLEKQLAALEKTLEELKKQVYGSKD